MMCRGRNSILAFAGLALLAIGLAACGSSSSSSGGSTVASTTGAANTVSTMSISGVGNLLVDSKGDVLYTNSRDSGSKIACTGSCTGIWPPLAAPSAGQPTSGNSSVQAKLGVVKRSDGSSQVTYGGKPLYTFVQDSPGKATGNAATDSFGGTSFTWTAATGGGSSPAASSSTSSNSSGGSGGYGY